MAVPRAVPPWRSLSVRPWLALGVAAAGFETLTAVGGREGRSRRGAVGRLAPGSVPSVAHLLALIAGLALLALVPRLWRGTRAAVPLASAGLGLLAALNVFTARRYQLAALELGLAALLVVTRGAFALGARNRPRRVLVLAGSGSWLMACCALLVGPLSSAVGGRMVGRVVHRAIRQAPRVSLGQPHASGGWVLLIDALIGCAVLLSLLVVRSLLRPAAGSEGHSQEEHRAARAIAERYGEDSLSPFILRPDKALHFTEEGVLAYRLIGGIAVVSGDPIASPEAAGRVLASFLAAAHQRGWRVAVWGASERTLPAYRALGLHVARAGEEAFVNPAQFTLEGRRVRKLRQSVHRVQRRGWQVTVCDGRDLDASLESEIGLVESAWRAGRRRLLGYAMGMGAFQPEVRPEDLYLLARSPEGDLGAVMRFAWHCGRLSLDTMRRIGETPNGLNEALVSRALEVARDRGVIEVSLNYAGLAHLARPDAGAGRTRRRVDRFVLALLGRQFQLQRLVRFNEKFHPQWRPRFLVYESRAALPPTALRVLQAEGYLPQPRALQLPGWWPARARPGIADVHAVR